MTTPRTHALRFFIWAYASPRGWNVTYNEIAEALGEPVRSVASVIHHAGWAHRIRASERQARKETWGDNGANRIAAHYIAADLAAGRIGNDAGV